jgi:predicted transcriptional regulator
MPATTLKISDELKARIVALAAAHGKSPHAYMLEALERDVTQAEWQASFIQDALEAEREMQASNTAYAANDVHDYITKLAKGEKPKRPKAIKWRE